MTTDYVAFDLSANSKASDTTPTEAVERREGSRLRSESGKPSFTTTGIIRDGLIDVSLMRPDGSVSTGKQEISQSESRAIELAKGGWIVVRVSTVIKS